MSSSATTTAATEQVIIPLELEREIFLSALEPDFSNTLDLILVAKRAFEWLKPVLFQTVVIHEFRRWPPPLAKIPFMEGGDTISPETFAAIQDFFNKNGVHVQNLLIEDQPNSNFIPSILGMCPHLRNFAFWSHLHFTRPRPDEATANSSNKMTKFDFSTVVDMKAPIRRLTGDVTKVKHLTQSDSNGVDINPFFSGITHLYINAPFKSSSDIGVITHMTSLTHLAVPDNTSSQLLTKILQDLPILKVLVTVGTSILKTRLISKGRGHAELDDKLPVELKDKLVGMWCAVISDWEKGAKGLDDMWVLAEKTLREREEERNKPVKSDRDGLRYCTSIW